MKYNKKKRISYKLRKNNPEGNRICINKTGSHIYGQVIDKNGFVISSSSSLQLKCKGYNVDGAKLVGSDLGKKLSKLNITNLYFDRGGFKYQGRVAAFADSMREFVRF